MPEDQIYKQFVKQFNVSEWRRLCRHRLFLHFLKIDLKTAASIASEALDRPVAYTFPKQARKSRKKATAKATSPSPRRASLRHTRRFRM